ncbi:unnamed protein product, partial [marine sediment metagenome]
MKTTEDKKRECKGLSIVIPVFNEEAVVPRLLERLNKVAEELSVTCKLIFVDDGST